MNSQDEEIPRIFRDSTNAAQKKAAVIMWKRISVDRHVRCPLSATSYKNPAQGCFKLGMQYQRLVLPCSNFLKHSTHVTRLSLAIGQLLRDGPITNEKWCKKEMLEKYSCHLKIFLVDAECLVLYGKVGTTFSHLSFIEQSSLTIY